IVFVHGLCGHHRATWTRGEIFWPKDLLPLTCPKARILSFGYNAKFIHFFPLNNPKRNSEITVDDHSVDLLGYLSVLRTDELMQNGRPIVFVAHSLGGLVCANALTIRDELSQELVNSTRGIIFLGTPIQGSAERWAPKLMTLLGPTSVDTKFLKDLETRSIKTSTINHDFQEFLRVRDRSGNPIKVACFFEAKSTYIWKKNVGWIVEKESAVLAGYMSIAVAADHMSMCKYEETDSVGYMHVSRILRSWIKDFESMS
ncbi:hypothetical protein K469DRAFT_466043, partial [Zopfia rhizophila CBS 207.26]